MTIFIHKPYVIICPRRGRVQKSCLKYVLSLVYGWPYNEMNHEISKISGSDIMMVTYDLRIYRIPYTVNQKNLQNLPFYNISYYN